jgi:hypothetical protein
MSQPPWREPPAKPHFQKVYYTTWYDHRDQKVSYSAMNKTGDIL